MATAKKRIGFFLGEEKVTLVEFDKNAPPRAVSSPLGSKATTTSSFNSSFTEEIQLTATLQKLLQDNRIMDGSFYVSLPMKEIILRSFVVPFVKKEEIQNALKFEARKYLPIDIQDLNFVFYTSPFQENDVKRLQIIFFGVRKESLARYERIFKQVNAEVSYCEPCMVSLTKLLLFRKEITPTDHLAFLILDNTIGRICFIDRGIPQFIREFTINTHFSPEEAQGSPDNLNLRIVNEVGSSIDFYARQFIGERIEQILISAQGVGEELYSALETELKIKLKKASPIVTLGSAGDSNDMDTIYAMGACVDPPIKSLSGFNFFEDRIPKSRMDNDFFHVFMAYKAIVVVVLIVALSVLGLHIYLQRQLSVLQRQYDQLSSQQGAFAGESTDSIEGDSQQDAATLTQYKGIRTRSDVAHMVLKVASHLPKGTWLQSLNINYTQNNAVTIDMQGQVFNEDPNEELNTVNQLSADFKGDKDLKPYIKNVSVTFNLQVSNGHEVTGFTIHCS